MPESDRLIRTAILTLEPGAQTGRATALPLPEGVTGLKAEGRILRVSYDLRHVDIPAIESWLAANGIRLSNGLIDRFKRKLAAFKDENRKDQAAIVHQCCSVPPKGD
jgi:hypothetical protein